eukprot:COSAG04_NODE_4081_length_2318_cov_3.772871_1_plen_89_part_10
MSVTDELHLWFDPLGQLQGQQTAGGAPPEPLTKHHTHTHPTSACDPTAVEGSNMWRLAQPLVRRLRSALRGDRRRDQRQQRAVHPALRA